MNMPDEVSSANYDLMRAMNSERASGLSLNAPRNADVMV